MLNYHGPLLSSALALFPNWINLVDDAGGIDQQLTYNGHSASSHEQLRRMSNGQYLTS